MLKWLLWLNVIQLCILRLLYSLFTFILTCWCCLAAAVINSTRVPTNGLHMICNKERQSLISGLLTDRLVFHAKQSIFYTASWVRRKWHKKVPRNQQQFTWKLTALFTPALSEILITTKKQQQNSSSLFIWKNQASIFQPLCSASWKPKSASGWHFL